MIRFTVVIRILWAALREIFDEAAYSRFLQRSNYSSSPAAYAAFCRDRDVGPLAPRQVLLKIRIAFTIQSLERSTFRKICKRPQTYEAQTSGYPHFSYSILSASAWPQGDPSIQTMRPVIRGRHAAVSSMKAEATEAARRILDAGGNAFDAAVAGQAALAVTDFSLNGVGSDAVLLVYNAREKKVYSINAEPRAPKLATIEWYEKNNGGKIPESDGLLSGGIPGVVDAWFILLDRWGTMNFEQVLQPAIDLAENGFPLSELGASYIANTKKIRKYPTTTKIYLPNGQPPKPGDTSQESGSRTHPEEIGRGREIQSHKRTARGLAGCA